ncbi:MAG: transposase [Phaeodactylibacter sp.]|nr:transposase [Phaeodactylibacter sp.]
MKDEHIPKNHLAELHADYYYHVYNRTNNKELLFRNDDNRILFLEKYKEYLQDYLHTYAYCLLGNHFHLLVRIRSMPEIYEHVQNIKAVDRTAPQKQLMQMAEEQMTVHQVLAQQFTRLFTSYAMRFNNMWKRNGNLFYRPFKRVEVDSEVYFTKLIHYIHTNPVKHKLVKDFTAYQWSSYRAFLSEKPTSLERTQVLDWFGGKQHFVEFHQLKADYKGMEDLLIED